MSVIQLRQSNSLPAIAWEKLPDDFVLPDDPVESNLQPLLASALRESLALAGLILESMLIASNFGICATVGGKTVVKAPDWVYIPSVDPLALGETRRSYTPHAQGAVPDIVLEFISETEGEEYSTNSDYPYGKFYFYDCILQVPVYGVFKPKTGELDVYRLGSEKYEQQLSDGNNHFWVEEIGLFLGVWWGKREEVTAHWLRWWDRSGNLLLWGNELVAQERQRLERVNQQLERESQRAEHVQLALEQERISRQRLAEKLQELGIDPKNL
jgi:hypothetical protein